ncbi:MAG: DEAD/DEAH box helicase [Candidatus Helarchaeota archaeon]
MELVYDRGTIKEVGGYALPNAVWDERVNAYRAPAYRYREIKEYLDNSQFPYEDRVLDLVPCPPLTSSIKLRTYQQEALECWLQLKRGIIIMPTGAGKTILAIKIIESVNSPTIIVVPTLALLQQWKEELRVFNIRIGEYSGVQKEIQPITVATYDSAYLNAEKLGNKFKCIIFDEVHHLPAERYRQIAEMSVAPYRLGLTATYEREDGAQVELNRLIGGVIYEVKTEELSPTYLAPYEIVKLSVELTEAEKQEYDKYYGQFRNYVKSRKIPMRRSSDFKLLVMRSGSDPEGRAALLERNEAERIAFNCNAKFGKLRDLLNREDRIIIFTKYNDMVYEISKRFLIPCITHRTAAEERKEILSKFKTGKYTALVSSQVLDEGIDVPEANIGILMSGSGSNREFIQRLGRLLRPRSGKKAILYELVTKSTKEVRTSSRRKR